MGDTSLCLDSLALNCEEKRCYSSKIIDTSYSNQSQTIQILDHPGHFYCYLQYFSPGWSQKWMVCDWLEDYNIIKNLFFPLFLYFEPFPIDSNRFGDVRKKSKKMNRVQVAITCHHLLTCDCATHGSSSVNLNKQINKQHVFVFSQHVFVVFRHVSSSDARLFNFFPNRLC